MRMQKCALLRFPELHLIVSDVRFGPTETHGASSVYGPLPEQELGPDERVPLVGHEAILQCRTHMDDTVPK